jgi:sigma-54 dependent transcriptional regulator of gfr operon
MREKKLQEYLAEQTEKLEESTDKTSLTAQEISRHFNVKRNTISHYLNQMVKAGEAVKINSRPVYFIYKETFEKKYHALYGQVYDCFEQLMNDKFNQLAPSGNVFSSANEDSRNSGRDVFNDLVGTDGSLRRAIEQIKMAALYPNNGLPLIISGPTGVGKSYIAKLMHRFCIEKKVLRSEAPFLILNCAQYVDNPELLSANLFGYIKGAFTGANKTTHGKLEAADGGILFLDEVHRLSPEGQEKLFVFMDTGAFQRLGESKENHFARVRLVFATTRALKETFLDTFLRRIPITVSIPALEERGRKEKKELLYRSFLEEAKTLGRSILLSCRMETLLLNHIYESSVGELIGTIKYICANAYSASPGTGRLELKITSFPDKVFFSDTEKTASGTDLSECIVFDPNMELERFFQQESRGLLLIQRTFEAILDLYARYTIKSIFRNTFEKKVSDTIQSLASMLVFKISTSDDSGMMKYITASMQEIFHYIEHSQNCRFNGDCVYILSAYFYHKMDHVLQWNDIHKKQLDGLYHYTMKYHNKENILGHKLIHLIEKRKELTIAPEDEIFLAFYCKTITVENTHAVKAVILAHGYATASSIAGVANKMLGSNVLEAFDMPMGTSSRDLAMGLNKFIRENDISGGLIIMVDIGSLKDIYRNLEKYIAGPIAIIDNVSTQIALWTGEMILAEKYFEEIVEKLKLNYSTHYQVIYPQRQMKKVIITTCPTGIGTASRLQKMLQRSIPESLDIGVIAYDYDKLKNVSFQESLSSLYDILGIVGTLDPKLDDVNFISLEDLISGQGKDRIYQIFKQLATDADISVINDHIVRNFSLESVMNSLTILDKNKVMEVLDMSFTQLEFLFKASLPNDKKLALYIHMSCMIERLIRHDMTVGYALIDEFKQCQQKLIEKLKKAFSVVESTYSVVISDMEIGMIYDILHNKTENSEAYF